MATGYNIDNINSLMNNIVDKYNSLDETISSEFNTLKDALRTNWVGEDEQDFEQVVRQKLNDLYKHAYSAVQYSVDCIAKAGNDWITNQYNNRVKIDGVASSFSTNTSGEITKPTIEQKEAIAVYDLPTISSDANRGLTADDSTTQIQTAITTIVTNIKSAVKSINDAIDSSDAFLGTQSTQVNDFLESTHNTISDILTSIQDVYNCAGIHAGENYVGAENSFVSSTTDQLSTDSESLSSFVSEDSKWQG